MIIALLLRIFFEQYKTKYCNCATGTLINLLRFLIFKLKLTKLVKYKKEIVISESKQHFKGARPEDRNKPIKNKTKKYKMLS